MDETTAHLRRRHAVHAALEEVGAYLRVDPLASAVLDLAEPAASRLAAELDDAAGPGWRDEPLTSPAAAAWVARVRTHGGAWGGWYAAHHRTLAVAEAPDRAAALRAGYDLRLRAVVPDPVLRERIEREALVAGGLARALVEEARAATPVPVFA